TSCTTARCVRVRATCSPACATRRSSGWRRRASNSERPRQSGHSESRPMRILEVSDGEGAAAFCAKLCARWGHEVIKVESPEREPPKPAFDLYLNGGKRRVAADFRRQDGRATIEALAERCDVLVTDARPRDVRDHRLLELGGTSGV